MTDSELQEALEDIDAYLETMPAKTDDWSIGYEVITPYVKSLRVLRTAYASIESLFERRIAEMQNKTSSTPIRDDQERSTARTEAPASSPIRAEDIPLHRAEAWPLRKGLA